MANNTSIVFRTDSYLKQKAFSLFKELEIPLSVALNTFLNMCVRTKSIPVYLSQSNFECKKNDVINFRINDDLKEQALLLAEQYGKTISEVLNSFLTQCVEERKIPFNFSLKDLDNNNISNKRVLPLFLDYTGTTDRLLEAGAENVKDFFDTIIDMQNSLDVCVQIIIVTGSDREVAKSKFKPFLEMAENYGLPNLFRGVFAEYYGYLIEKDKEEEIQPIAEPILRNIDRIQEITKQYSGKINPKAKSILNITFDSITEEKLYEFANKINSLINSDDIETVVYYDAFGKECDVKAKIINKAAAVSMTVSRLQESYDVPYIVIGGDSQDEDVKMYLNNKMSLDSQKIESVFITPIEDKSLTENDSHVIVGNWEDARGIIKSIRATIPVFLTAERIGGK